MLHTKVFPFMKDLPLSKKSSLVFNGNTHDMFSLNKIRLIQLFNLVALLFIVPLSIRSFVTQDYNIALPLLGVGLLMLFNFYYLKISKNETFASHFLSSVFLVLMTYLLYTGGINNTGPLWVSSLPIIVFFLLGLKKGFYYIFIFLILACIILFIPFDFNLKASYPQDFNLRILLSFVLITFLSAMYEYNNVKVFDTMKKLREELEYTATRDHLTSLYNRRGYEKHIQNIPNPNGIILMCDMDLFKKVNDNYGHDTGDFVLQEVALSIQSMIRKEDVAVRWGGEEFFVFLPCTSVEQGVLVAEKIRVAIENLSLVYNEHSIETTLSIGLAEVSKDISLQKSISNADIAMYHAKKAGRNTVSIYVNDTLK